MDWSSTTRMLAKRLATKKPHEKLFDITAESYRAAWRVACAALRSMEGCSSLAVGPPHSVRHAGPSRDSASGYRSVWQIQRRGRWSSEKSVMRYAKTWAWTSALARTPPAIMQRGAELMCERGVRAPIAKE